MPTPRRACICIGRDIASCGRRSPSGFFSEIGGKGVYSLIDRVICFYHTTGKLILFLALGLFLSPVFSIADQTLTEQLHEKAEAAKTKSDPKRAVVMQKAIDDLNTRKMAEKAVKKGDLLPAFRLPDVKNRIVDSRKLLKKGPLVVVFYRGGWCPYCNLQLADLQKNLAKIKEAGATLVAISPQTPDNSLSTAEKAKLDFYVLSDKGGDVAREFGLMYRLPDDLVEVYKGFGLNLSKTNGTDGWELPLTATYVVATDGKIAYSFLDADYKKRAETMDIIDILHGLKEK